MAAAREAEQPFLSSAQAYDRHVGRYGNELASAMIAVTGVRPGMRALDVGCGPGALTTALVRLLGPAEVSAVDPAEPLVDACRARAPGTDVRVGIAEELPFRDEEFDAVLAQLVLNHLNDAPRGVREMRRVAYPGAVVAACVWDFAEGMTMLRSFWDAALAVDPEGAAAAGAGRRMPFCQPEELRELWREGGLHEVDVGDLAVGADYSDFDDFWLPFAAGAGASGRYCVSLSQAEQTALREEVRRRVGSPEGPFRMTARAWYVRGYARE
jgi:SAM-dependent methyltransferase